MSFNIDRWPPQDVDLDDDSLREQLTVAYLAMVAGAALALVVLVPLLVLISWWLT